MKDEAYSSITHINIYVVLIRQWDLAFQHPQQYWF